MSSNQTLTFFKPDINNIGEYSAVYRKNSHLLYGCEYTPATVLLWEPFYHQKIAVKNNSIFLMFDNKNTVPVFLLPLGGDLKENVNLLKEYTNSKNIPLYFLGQQGELLEEFKRHFGSEYNFEQSRDDFEYIYRADDLKNLSGKKYHSKRNHISAFNRTYNWKYEELTLNNLEQVLNMADKWAELSESEDKESLLSENRAIKTVLPFMETLDIKGGIIKIEGEIAAFCFGTKINDSVFDVSVEKALPKYRTAYTVINKEFASRLGEDVKYINREDDMGIEGLRKAKLSYHPNILLEKYYISPK